ncbi:hypothetical protein RR21198_6010, partial [Rhodococcus rhodochrous ATCC 21198]
MTVTLGRRDVAVLKVSDGRRTGRVGAGRYAEAMPGVFERLVGQRDVETELTAAATAARGGGAGSRMTHSW